MRSSSPEHTTFQGLQTLSGAISTAPSFCFFCFKMLLFMFWLCWSSCCTGAFSSCGRQELLSSRAASLCRGFFCRRAWALGTLALVVAAHGFTRGVWGLLFYGTWDLPRPRIKPVCPALRVGFLTTGHQGSPLLFHSGDSTREGMDILLRKCPDGKREARAYLSRALQAL